MMDYMSWNLRMMMAEIQFCHEIEFIISHQHGRKYFHFKLVVSVLKGSLKLAHGVIELQPIVINLLLFGLT